MGRLIDVLNINLRNGVYFNYGYCLSYEIDLIFAPPTQLCNLGEHKQTLRNKDFVLGIIFLPKFFFSLREDLFLVAMIFPLLIPCPGRY